METLDQLTAYDKLIQDAPQLTWEIAESLRDEMSEALLKIREKHTHWIHVRLATETDHKILCTYRNIMRTHGLPETVASALSAFTKKLAQIIIHAGEIEEGSTLNKPLKTPPLDNKLRTAPALVDPESTTSSTTPDIPHTKQVEKTPFL